MRLRGVALILLHQTGQRCCISCRAMILATVMDLIRGVVATRDRSTPARFKDRAARFRAEPLAHPSAAVFAMTRDRSTQKDRISIALSLAALALTAVLSGCATTGGEWNDADTSAFIGGFTGYPVYSTPVYRPPPRRYVPPPRQTAPVYRPPPQQTYPSGGSSDDCDWENGACSAQ